MREFLLSDESLNSQGSIIMTDGIRLDRFLANPVMFYNHEQGKGVVGRWENVRKENGKLYGTPVFDVNHELGRTLQQQVNGGFVRGASIGIGSVEYDYAPTSNDVMKVISCELLEVSVCDIPSNSNALQLYYDGKPVDGATHRRLALNQSTLSQPGMDDVLAALGLPSNATVDQILAAIARLKNGEPLSVEERVNLAVKRGYIEASEKTSLIRDFRNSATGLSAYLKRRSQDFEKTVDQEYNDLLRKDLRSRLINVGKLQAIPQNEIKDMIRNNFATFKRFVECIERKRWVMDDIVLSGSDRREMRMDWTLDDYRRKDPAALRKDPALLARLLEQEKNQKQNK